ncbi:MAG: endo alpha-1,4 polygalactosaminidase [Anaerovoracaceae bacterium]|jgi:hypothetical protein
MSSTEKKRGCRFVGILLAIVLLLSGLWMSGAAEGLRGSVGLHAQAAARSSAGRHRSKLKKYGVFLGISRSRISRLKNYRSVVIEPEAFTRSDVTSLHKKGKKVYAYLNIGSIEKSRSYYSRFAGITLGAYDDWPDERWVDVSRPAWQRFIVDELAKKYVSRGYDGFFLDNADVYDRYHTASVYSGLCSIIKGLRQYHKRLIMNGGDVFVTACMNHKNKSALPYAVNQEEVYTRINFSKKTFGRQRKSVTKYYLKYLRRAKKHGMRVYLLEYGAGRSLSASISRGCKKYGFVWYNAGNINLSRAASK